MGSTFCLDSVQTTQIADVIVVSLSWRDRQGVKHRNAEVLFDCPEHASKAFKETRTLTGIWLFFRHHRKDFKLEDINRWMQEAEDRYLDAFSEVEE